MARSIPSRADGYSSLSRARRVNTGEEAHRKTAPMAQRNLISAPLRGTITKLGCLLLFAGSSFAQGVTVTAEVDPNPAGLDDQVSLIVTVNSSGGNSERPQLSRIEGLKLVSGPSVSNQFQWINGQSSSSQSFTY